MGEASEKTSDALGSEVVKPQVEVAIRGDVFSGDEYGAVLGLDGRGRLAYDIFLDDKVLFFVGGVCAANPSGGGHVHVDAVL